MLNASLLICLVLAITVIIYAAVFYRWCSKIQEIIRKNRLQDEEFNKQPNQIKEVTMVYKWRCPYCNEYEYSSYSRKEQEIIKCVYCGKEYGNPFFKEIKEHPTK